MTEAEIDAALCAMVREANDVIGFRTLLESDRWRVNEVERIQFEAYIAAAGHGLALKVFELRQRLRREGIDP